MNLGLVLGGVADGATNTYAAQQANARANQAAADAHAQQLRIQQAQHDADMATAATDNAATQASTAADQAAAQQAIPTQAAPAATPDAPPPPAPPPPPMPDDSSGIPVGGTVPNAPAPAPAPAPQAKAIKASWSPSVIQTIIQETGGKDPVGVGAVASTIANRARLGNESLDQVVSDKGQFGMGAPAQSGEHAAWVRTAARTDAQPGSPLYKKAEALAAPYLTGQATAGNFTGYYSPAASIALGEKPPKWDDGTGVNIAGNRFFSHAYHGAQHAANPQNTPAPTVGSPNAPAADAEPQQAFYSSNEPTLYDPPQGGPPMVTSTPLRSTQDSAADALMYRKAAIYRAAGFGDQANQMEAGIQSRQKAASDLNAADLTQKVARAQDAIANIETVSDIPAAYSMISNHQHVQASQDSTGTIHVNFYSNADPTKLLGTDSFSPTFNDDGTPKMTGLQVMKTNAAAMLSSPASYRDVIDKHGDMVAQTAQKHAAANQANAAASRDTADVAAGVPQATAANLQGTAADAQAHAADTAFQTQTKQKVQSLSQQAMAEGDPAKRGVIQSQIAGLTGQINPQRDQIIYQGQPATLTTYGNGLQTVTDIKSGVEYKYGDEPVVVQTLAKAAKQNIPLTYGMERDAQGNVHPLYRIAGVKGASEDAADVVAAYQAQKNASAIPAPTATPTAADALPAGAPQAVGGNGFDVGGIPGR